MTLLAAGRRHTLAAIELFPSASEVRRLATALDHLTAPIVTTRRLLVAGSGRRAGTSTVAGALARVLARARTGRILLHTTDQDRLTGTLRSATPRPGSALPPRLNQDPRFRRGLWQTRDDIDDRSFDVHVIDGPPLRSPSAAREAFAAVHAACLVLPFQRSRAEESLALALDLAGRPGGPGILVVFCATTDDPTTWPRQMSKRLPIPSVVLPFDEALRKRHARARPRTERALVTLTGEALDASRIDTTGPAPRREGTHAS